MADVLGFFRKAMPYLSVGLSLAGPAGNAAAAILGKTLGQASPTTKSVTDALSSLTLTPELQAQLKEAELQYQQVMVQAGYQNAEELAQIAAADRASARQMQTSTRSWLPAILSVLVTVGFFGLVTLVLFHPVPGNSEKTIDILTGSFTAAWVAVINYWFGSSAGSDRKTEIMANGNGH